MSTVYDPFLSPDPQRSSPPEYHDFNYIPKEPPKSGFYAYFEPTDWKGIIMHIVFTLVAYPFLILICLAASNKILFWSRVIVGAGCGILGFCLGYNPYRFARRYLEAGSAFILCSCELTPTQNLYSFSMGNFHPREYIRSE